MRYPPGGRVEYRAVWRSHTRPKGRYPMYKNELIKTMVKKTEEQNVPLTAKQMESALSALLESVTDALKSGEKVVLPGFGIFGVKMRPARRGYNPSNGAAIMILERKVPGFKAGKKFKDAVAADARQCTINMRCRAVF